MSTFAAENFCFMSPCLNGGTCMEALGSHSCICMEGFSGSACESKLPRVQITLDSLLLSALSTTESDA